jgi:hypothetical protein
MSTETSPADFWAPRRCLLPPPPEMSLAADLLSQAADALLAQDRVEADGLVRGADLKPVCDYYDLVAGPTDSDVHRFRVVPGSPQTLQRREKRRMPPAVVSRRILARDGWRCRFCECRVLATRAVRHLRVELPEASCWPSTNSAKHCAIEALHVSRQKKSDIRVT